MLRQRRGSQGWRFTRCRSSVQKGLKSFYHNAHIWSKISFVLHTQSSNCSHLFDQCRFWEIGVDETWRDVRRCRSIVCSSQEFSVLVTYLCNGLRRVISTESSVNTLLHFIFTKSWCCLITDGVKRQWKVKICQPKVGASDIVIISVSWRLIPMSQDSVGHVVMYDQQVYGQWVVQGVQHQSCKHHSLNSADQSLHICNAREV